MKKKLGIIVLTLAAVVLILAVGKKFSKEQVIYINEVRSWDASTTRDGYYGSDYIELYNASEENISLHGWYVSDDASEMKKSQLSDVTIAAKDYVILYANGTNESGDSLNFKLNPSGEMVLLSDAQGNLVDSIYVPEQEFGTVYARITDGAKEWSSKEETTGYSNNEAKTLPNKCLEEPVFSHESGFYEEEFVLTIEAAPEQEIYYTLDGSKPDKTSLKYETGISVQNVSSEPNVENAVQNVVQEWKEYTPNPALVDKAVVVRAIATDSEGNVSDVATRTFFVGLENYRAGNVVSVVADFEDLFGDYGIFVTGAKFDKRYLSGDEGEWVAPNFFWSGRAWEVQGNMELIKKGEEVLNQKIGIRTQGGSARLIPKKRMSIFARTEYDDSPYLEGLNLSEKNIHSITFNESVSNAVLPALLKDRDVAVQDAFQSTLFLNGEFWYNCVGLEKYNKYYLEEHYGVNPENVIILKNQKVEEGPQNGYDLYQQAVAYAENSDLSVEENYAYLEEMVDMQSYIDYLCANIYLCNMDMSETKNYMLWKTVEEDGGLHGDGRWRWMMYDVDCLEWLNFGYHGVQEKAAIDSFDQCGEYSDMAMNEHRLYVSAKANEGFCKQFVLSFLDMANVNFSVDYVENVFSEWIVAPDIFGDFFERRFEFIVPYMAEEFDLTGTLEEVTLKVNDTEGGTIQLNTTTPDISKGSWTGRYYTDYPVTVTAVPADGYEFVGWSGSVTSDSATIEAEVVVGGITLEAVFERAAN